ncbi:MAG: hypothetical protein WDN27_03695 [Candidatus Saccharibacteria bacterium]
MILSYNETEAQRQKFRQLFLPGWLNFAAETLLAVVILLALDLSDIQAGLLTGVNASGTIVQNPLPFLEHRLSGVLDGLSKYHWASQLTVFALWAIIGMLAYLLIYRVAQISNATARSLHEGVMYVRTEHGQGLHKWLGSLHDIFMKVLLKSAGLILIIVGAFLAFTYANLELHIALLKRVWQLR